MSNLFADVRSKPLEMVAYEGDESNWDLYATGDGIVYSLAREGSGASDSTFGGAGHIRRLLRQGYGKNWVFTAFGAAFVGEDCVQTTLYENESRKVG